MRCLMVLVLLAGSASGVEHEMKPSAVDPAVGKGLDFLAKDALAWKEKHKCVSCHHAALVIWPLREAKEVGYAVDEPVLESLTTWVADSGDGKVSQTRPTNAPNALNTKALYFALGLNGGFVVDQAAPGGTELSGLQRLLATVQGDQTENGSWSAWPETRSPMFGGSDQSMTALALLTLLPTALAGEDSAKKAVDQGVQWLTTVEPDDEFQSVALRLVLWRRLGRPAEEWEPLVKTITSKQNADGGWSQALEMRSDAWATGQALYALAHAGDAVEQSVMARGKSFLIGSQLADGSWPMVSRPSKPGGKGATNLVPITGAGTAWAVLGLIRGR